MPVPGRGYRSSRAYCEDCGGVGFKHIERRKWYRPPNPGDRRCAHAHAITPTSGVGDTGGCAFLSYRRIVTHPDRYCPDCGAWHDLHDKRWVPVGVAKEAA